ncbi:hypothetical protein NC651_037307 [Populus alba x Populus x berolinensis]|nr:hypothetical protein NC651_037307 [Populus alba x Populus x berolinensis]
MLPFLVFSENSQDYLLVHTCYKCDHLLFSIFTPSPPTKK